MDQRGFVDFSEINKKRRPESALDNEVLALSSDDSDEGGFDNYEDDVSDESDSDQAPPQKSLKAAKQKKAEQLDSDDEEEDEESDDEMGDVMEGEDDESSDYWSDEKERGDDEDGWGSRKNIYYGTDYVDDEIISSDEEGRFTFGVHSKLS